MLFGMSLRQIILYFCIYSFLGWIIEVVYHAVSQGRIVNRGFLNGPVCPIYGFGALTVVSLSGAAAAKDPSLSNPVTVFFFGMLLASCIEYFAGWLLDKLFRAQWWDYSDKPWNLRGYICLEFSILWGIASVIEIFILHPFIETLTAPLLPAAAERLLLSLLCLVYLGDVVSTVLKIRHFSADLQELEQFHAALRSLSDSLSAAIGSKTLQTQQKIEEGQLQAALASAEIRDAVQELREAVQQNRAETEQKLTLQRAGLQRQLDENRQELEQRVEKLRKKISSSPFGAGRLLKAFPGLRSRRHGAALEMLKKLFQ